MALFLSSVRKAFSLRAAGRQACRSSGYIRALFSLSSSLFFKTGIISPNRISSMPPHRAGVPITHQGHLGLLIVLKYAADLDHYCLICQPWGLEAFLSDYFER